MESNIKGKIELLDEVEVTRLDSSFSAGFGMPFSDGISSEMIDKNLLSELDKPFVITASGDSMEQLICDGDTVICETMQQTNIVNGDIVVCDLNNTLLIKYFFFSEHHAFLKSENKKYTDIYLNEEDSFVIFGVPKAIQRKIRLKK